MCLYTGVLEKTPTIKEVTKIARSKKLCWKRFIKSGAGVLRTPYQYYDWPKEQEVSVTGLVCRVEPFRVRVNQGLHAYRSQLKAKVQRQFGETIRMMVIPEGAEFILGEKYRGEIVATRMRLATKEEIKKYKEKELKKLTKKK